MIKCVCSLLPSCWHTDDLHQLYKVFRIDGDYALSHLLLSHKDDESGGRMLIAIEVNSADQYDTAVRPFFPTHSGGGVLKFTVSDIQRRKEPINSASHCVSFASGEPVLVGAEVPPPSPMRTDVAEHERLARAHTFHGHSHRHGSRHHHHYDRLSHGSRGMHRNEESRRRSMGSFPAALPVAPVHFPLPIPGAFPAPGGPWNIGDRPLPPPPVGNAPHNPGSAWARPFVHALTIAPPLPHPPPAQQPEAKNRGDNQDAEMGPVPLRAAASNESLFSAVSNPSAASSIKDEIKVLIDGFVTDLNATLSRNGINELTLVDAASPSTLTSRSEVVMGQDKETALSNLHPGVICDHCNKPIQGIRYKVG